MKTSNEPIRLLNRNNLIWVKFFGFAGAALGSAVTVALVLVSVWAIVSIALQRFPLSFSDSTLKFSAVSMFYGTTVLVFSIANGLENWERLYGLAIFFAPLFLGARLSLSQQMGLLDGILVGAAFGTIALLPFSMFEYLALDLRASALAGNPGILATTTLVFGGLGGLNLVSKNRRSQILGLLSLIAMSLTVIGTGMRGAWVCLPLVLSVVFLATINALSHKTRIVMLGAWVLVFSSFLAFDSENIVHRLDGLSNNWERLVERGDYSTSLGKRIVMFQAGTGAVMKAPFTGYGLDGRMKAVNENIDPKFHIGQFPYTHPHNGFLAALLDAGILGLLALLSMLFTPFFLVLWESNRTAIWHIRLAAISIVLIAYVSSGLTNILFHHDVMDAVFIGTITIVLAGISGPAENRQKPLTP